VGDVDELEESGHADEVGVVPAAEVEDAATELLGGRAALARDDGGGDAGLPGAGQAQGVGAAGNDEDDAAGKPAVGGAVEEVLEGGAAAAEEDGEAEGSRHGNNVLRSDGGDRKS